MTYVIGEPRIDVMDRACVDEGLWTAFTRAVDRATSTPTSASMVVRANRFARSRPSTTRTTDPRSGRSTRRTTLDSSAETLSGHEEALGSPGGTGKVGPLGVDTELATCHPRTDEVARL